MTTDHNDITDDQNTPNPSLAPDHTDANGGAKNPNHFDAPGKRLARSDYANWTDRYEPSSIDELILPASRKRKLQDFAKKRDLPSMLFLGSAGIGKSVVAKALISDAGFSCHEINGALDRGIDTIREIVKKTNSRTVFGEPQAIFIDEIDGFTPEAQSGLRGNTMVGTSATSVFIATANNRAKLTDMVLNRFRVIDLETEIKRDRDELLPQHVERACQILEAEGVGYEKDAVAAIVQTWFPSMRAWLTELQDIAAAGPVITKTKSVMPAVLSPSIVSGATGPDPSSAGRPPAAILQPALPTEGSVLLDEIERYVARFVSTSAENIRAIALFVMHAHAHNAAYHSPLLWLSSPVMRCGKTTALRCISGLVPRPIITSNISVAGMLRAIADEKPTFLIDEMEHAIKANGHLHGVLNLGHTPDGVMVRADDRYSTWAPKVVALIGELDGTLADRSIRIALRRRLAAEVVERLRPEDKLAAAALRNRCEQWATANLPALQLADPDMPVELNDRAQDNWRPLLAIADLAEGGWSERAREAAVYIASFPEIDELPQGLVVLTAARDWLDQNPSADNISSRTLAEIAADAGGPSGKLPGRMIRVSRLLRGFEIKVKAYRDGDTVLKGYARDQLESAFKRYLEPVDAMVIE